jgi:hypothetical protein
MPRTRDSLTEHAEEYRGNPKEHTKLQEGYPVFLCVLCGYGFWVLLERKSKALPQGTQRVTEEMPLYESEI